MTRKKKTIIGCCVGLLLVIVACAVANRWLLQSENGYVVKNYIARRCWHKNVGQFAQKFGFPYFATQMSCHQKEAMSTDADTLCPCPEATILLQPYDDFTKKEAYQLENELAKHFDDILYGTWTFKVLPTKKMSSQWYYKPRNRYRADKIIGSLEHDVSRNARDTVIIALTHHDISTSIHGQKDYGVMGLSHRPGHACVVSTFRLKKHSQLWKLVIHEFIHAFFGYPHCPKDNTHCIMQDAHGKNTFDKKNDLCDYCKQHIG